MTRTRSGWLPMGTAAVLMLAASAVAAAQQQSSTEGQGTGSAQAGAGPGGGASSSQAPTQAPGRNIVEGRVVRKSSNQLVLKEPIKGNNIILQVDPKTPVVIGGLQKSIKDLEPGMDVHAAYDVVNGQPRAVEIQMQPLAPGEKEYRNTTPGPYGRAQQLGQPANPPAGAGGATGGSGSGGSQPPSSGTGQ